MKYFTISKLHGRNRAECTSYNNSGLFVTTSAMVTRGENTYKRTCALHVDAYMRTYVYTRDGFSILPSGKPHLAGDTHAKQEDGVLYHVRACKHTDPRAPA